MNIQNKNSITTILLGVCLWASPDRGQAQTTQVFSIKQAIDYASQNNQNIMVAQYDQEIGKQQIIEARGRALPQANINGTFEDKLKVPLLIIPGGLGGSEGGIPMGYQYNSSLSGEVTQMLFDQSFFVALKAAKTTNEFYKQKAAQVDEQTVYDVAQAYYQVIVVQKRLQLLNSNLASTSKTLANTELQFKNGLAKQVDVNRLRVNQNNLKSQIEQSEMSLVQAMNGLKFKMGMPMAEKLILADTALAFSPADEQIALATIEPNYNNRSDYQVLQSNYRLQELDVNNFSSAFFPKLTAFANYGYQAQGSDFGFAPTASNDWLDFTTASVGLRLSIPVFSGFQRVSRVQQSRIKALQVQEQIQQKEQNINMEVSNAQTQYRSTLQRIQSEQQNVKLAEEVYKVTQLEFQEGVSSSTDLVNAETSLREAQNTYITTLLNLYTARLDLEKSKGELLQYLNSK